MSTEKKIIERLSVPLDISDVEFRIQSITSSGYATILAYKDSRVDMNRLDEVCGENWQNKFELIDGQLFCSIGIKVDGEWIWRQNVGTESNTEKEKGRASDALKRAGFMLGIGRELYAYPRIFLQLKDANYAGGDKKAEFQVKEVSTANGKKKIGTAHYGLRLDKWTWKIEFDDSGKKPKRLTGYDQFNVLRFDSDKDFNGLPEKNQPQQKPQQQNTENKQKEPVKTEKKQMSPQIYGKAVKSDKIDVLEQALTTYNLTPEQLKGISGRIAELKEGKK